MEKVIKKIEVRVHQLYLLTHRKINKNQNDKDIEINNNFRMKKLKFFNYINKSLN